MQKPFSVGAFCCHTFAFKVAPSDSCSSHPNPRLLDLRNRPWPCNHADAGESSNLGLVGKETYCNKDNDGYSGDYGEPYCNKMDKVNNVGNLTLLLWSRWRKWGTLLQ